MAGFGDVLARLATKTADSVWTKANAGKGNAKTLREAIQEKQQERQQQQPEQQVQQPMQQANKIELKPQGNDSKKDAKKADEKKQERTQGEKAFGNFMQAFRNNAQRGINDISNGNMLDAQAQAEEIADSKDQLTPDVKTTGSNDAAQKATEVAEDETGATSERDTPEIKKVNIKPKEQEYSDNTPIGDFINAYMQAASQPKIPDNVVDTSGINVNNGYSTRPDFINQYLYNEGLTTPKELAQLANAGSDIKLDQDSRLQESKGTSENSPLQNAINEELDTNYSASDGGGKEQTASADELTYGLTQDQLNDMSDMALINLELQNNKALADYVKDNYGYDVDNKDAFGDFLYIEDPYDTSGKTDLARALFGLDENAAYNADDGIQDRLMNMLYSSGMERGLEGDDLVNAIVDTYFDPEDIVYLDKWTGLGEDAADYQAQNVLTYDDVAALVGRMADNEKYGGSGTMNEFLDQAGLDINDVGAWAMVGNMLNRDPSALRDLSDNDLALISSIFGDAGDMANFAFADSDRGKDYKEHEWKPSERTSYSMNDFMNALGQGAFDRMYNGEGVSSTLADWDQADTLMKAIEDASGRKVVRDR